MADAAPHVFVAMHEVEAAMSEEGIKKVRRGDQGAYRGIDDVYNVLSAALVKAKLLVRPTKVNRIRTLFERQGKSPAVSTELEITYTFQSAVDGSMCDAVIHSEGTDFSDKSTGKAFSYAYKQCMFQTFCIPIEGHSPDTDDEKPELPPMKPAAAAPPLSPRAAPAATQQPKSDRYAQYWPLFTNSSHVGQPVADLQDDELAEYIARLERARDTEKNKKGDPFPYRADALKYLEVATRIMKSRMPPEDFRGDHASH